MSRAPDFPINLKEAADALERGVGALGLRHASGPVPSDLATVRGFLEQLEAVPVAPWKRPLSDAQGMQLERAYELGLRYLDDEGRVFVMTMQSLLKLLQEQRLQGRGEIWNNMPPSPFKDRRAEIGPVTICGGALDPAPFDRFVHICKTCGVAYSGAKTGDTCKSLKKESK